jgi:hypothetical protein
MSPLNRIHIQGFIEKLLGPATVHAVRERSYSETFQNVQSAAGLVLTTLLRPTMNSLIRLQQPPLTVALEPWL